MQIGQLASRLAIIIASMAFEAPGAPSGPAGLFVNGVSNPLAIDRDTARFTWMSTDTVPTVKGLITTRWKKSPDGESSLSVKVPANTRAAIYIPKLSGGNAAVTESGKLLWPAKSAAEDPGVLAVSEEDLSIKCLVGTGVYRFCKAPWNSV
jgi:hypothetical protein